MSHVCPTESARALISQDASAVSRELLVALPVAIVINYLVPLPHVLHATVRVDEDVVMREGGVRPTRHAVREDMCPIWMLLIIHWPTVHHAVSCVNWAVVVCHFCFFLS